MSETNVWEMEPAQLRAVPTSKLMDAFSKSRSAKPGEIRASDGYGLAQSEVKEARDRIAAEIDRRFR